MKGPITSPAGVTLVTLGCSKNTVDSEKLAGLLHSNGSVIGFEKNTTLHPTVIINTCGFIDDAKQESIDHILAYVEEKKRGNIQKLVVWGCMTERYREELQTEIPEIDAIFGIEAFAQINRFLHPEETVGKSYERLNSQLPHYAYLKISEGCNRRCSFCAIPGIKGKHRSSGMEQLLEEARQLSNQGVKELILVAQDLSSYGIDLYDKKSLPELIYRLHSIEGLEWIRLHYAYPLGFPEAVLQQMNELPKLCKYLDIPFQHISDPILKRMRRGNTRTSTYHLIEKIRKKVPGIAIRTSLIAGYPGETSQDFKELCDFVRDIRFERLGVFAYSDEEDTAAYLEPHKISPKIIQKRKAAIMEIQQQISLEHNLAAVGKTFKVLIDRKEGDYFIGRTEFDSPEIDNEVQLSSHQVLTPGEFYPVSIIQAQDFDLEGILITGT